MSNNPDKLSLYNEESYGQSYLTYRWMAPYTFAQYYSCMFDLEEIECRDCIRILDVGCGTGQFSIRIAQQFEQHGYNYSIDAIDTSANELAILNSIAKANNLHGIKTINQNISDFMPTAKYDYIICSEMIHLIDDLMSFASHISGMLSEYGKVFIRTSSPHQLASRSTYKFFPKCLYLDLLRNKGSELITAAFALSGKRMIQTLILDESHTYPASFIIELFKHRAYSTLRLLSEQELERGIDSLSNSLAGKDNVLLDFMMTLYVVGD